MCGGREEGETHVGEVVLERLLAEKARKSMGECAASDVQIRHVRAREST